MRHMRTLGNRKKQKFYFALSLKAASNTHKARSPVDYFRLKNRRNTRRRSVEKTATKFAILSSIPVGCRRFFLCLPISFEFNHMKGSFRRAFLKIMHREDINGKIKF